MKKLTIFTLIIASIILIPRFSNAASSKNPTPPAVVNGVCDTGISSDNNMFESHKNISNVNPPTENFCTSGKVVFKNGAPAVTNSNDHWIWICRGLNGGKNITCSTSVLDGVTPNPKNPIPSPQAGFGNASSKKGGLVPACPVSGCGFNELMMLVNNVIKFLLVDIAVPLAAIVFAYAGFLLITAGGDPGKTTKAKLIIKNLLIGFVIALAAWLIVNTILSTLGFSGSFLTH